MKYLILHLFLFINLFTFSQELLKQSVNIKQDGLTCKFYVLDQDEKGIKNYNDSKYYYWFKAQKVMSTQGGSSGNLLDGVFQSFYSNNQLFEQGSFEKGLKTGEWKRWDFNGTLIRTENWKNGKLSGKQTEYDGKGQVTSQTYIKRRITVIRKVDTTIVIKGSHTKTTYCDSLGHKTGISRTKNGLLHGKQESLNTEGEWSISRYKNGELCEEKNKEATTEEDKEQVPFYKRIFKKKTNPEKPLKQKKKKDDNSVEPKQKKKLISFKKKKDD